MGWGDRPCKFHEALCEELIVFAEQEFRAARIKADGSTEKQHNEALDRIRAGLPRKKKAAPAAKEGPACPWQLAYLWRFFIEVLNGASGGGMGPATIAWVDIRAWADLTGEVIEPWEAQLMLRLSAMRAEIVSEDVGKGQGGASRPVGVHHGR